MPRKTLFPLLLVFTCVVSQDPVGGDGQTSSVAAKQQMISSVTVKPLEANGLKLPLTVAEPDYVNIIRDSLAVDETGYFYLAFSITISHLGPGRWNETPNLVKYDQSGRLVAVFPLPAFLFAHPDGGAYLTSVVVSGDKVYASVHWMDERYAPRKAVLIYTKTGSYQRSIDIPGQFFPYQVVVSPTGDLFVLGEGSLKDRFGVAGTNMIIKLSPSGEVLTSFSPYPVDPHLARDLSRRNLQNHLLVDPVGRLIHVLPDATMRVFDLDGRLVKTLSLILPVGDSLYSVIRCEGMFVFGMIDRQRRVGYQVVVSPDGEVVSWVEMSEPLIKVQGRDGNYYAISLRPRPTPSAPPELQIRKMKLDLSQ